MRGVSDGIRSNLGEISREVSDGLLKCDAIENKFPIRLIDGLIIRSQGNIEVRLKVNGELGQDVGIQVGIG